jgi:hypothetical protein
MWKLLKAEFIYDRFVIGIGFSLVLTVSVVFLLLGGSDLPKSIPAYRAVLFCSAAIVWLTALVKLQKEKRERMHSLVPVTRHTTGLSRQLYLILFWSVIASLYLLCNWIVKGNRLGPADLLVLASITGMVLLANALTFLQKDLRYLFTGKFAKLILSVLFFILICAGYFIFIISVMSFEVRPSFDALRIEMRTLFFSGWGALFLSILGLGFAALDHWVFLKRKTYLE